ncbi:MAG: hypothetical protein IPG72_14890 [Ardenticatenales bacterium]|nr:hypothetical protein [Ardenticatenales bacterium]
MTDVATAHPVTLRTAATDTDAAADAEPIDVLVVGRDIAGAGRRYLSAAGDAAAVQRALDAGAVTISEPSPAASASPRATS